MSWGYDDVNPRSGGSSAREASPEPEVVRIGAGWVASAGALIYTGRQCPTSPPSSSST